MLVIGPGDDFYMQVLAIKSGIFKPGNNLIDYLVNHIGSHSLEGKILAITSKIISLHENCLVEGDEAQKTELIKRESDLYIGEVGYGCHLTVKHGLMIPSAGIDESNSEGGEFILYPKDPFKSAESIYWDLKNKLGLKQFGVLLTDSHTKPLRRGVVGAGLAYFGFKGVIDKRKGKDLFGRELKMTQINVVDALSAAAVFMMGEGDEGRPLAIVNAEVEFGEQSPIGEISISVDEDLYGPLFQTYLKNKD